MAEGEYVRSLFVTLRRGLVGKSWMHRRVLTALGLRHPHQCLEKPNNESIRGMVQKVAHLVIVETDKMFYLRNLREYYKQLPREELVVHHGAAVAAHLQQQQQSANSCADADYNASTSSSTSQSQAPQPAQPAATWLGSTWTSVGSSYSPETAMSQDFRTWLPPMQSIHIQSHLQVMGMQWLMLEVGGQLVDRKENRQMAIDSATGV
ncbi:ribosomal protein L30p/L7e-domain-containing protein [Haematococcus lacustris]